MLPSRTASVAAVVPVALIALNATLHLLHGAHHLTLHYHLGLLELLSRIHAATVVVIVAAVAVFGRILQFEFDTVVAANEGGPGTGDFGKGVAVAQGFSDLNILFFCAGSASGNLTPSGEAVAAHSSVTHAAGAVHHAAVHHHLGEIGIELTVAVVLADDGTFSFSTAEDADQRKLGTGIADIGKRTADIVEYIMRDDFFGRFIDIGKFCIRLAFG